MMILKMLGKILATIGIIVFSALLLAIKVIENIGAHVAGLALVLLGILALMAIISTNWFALTVFVVLAVGVVGLLFGAATLEVIFETGRDAIKTCLK